jgi:hypothetical protein
MLALLDAEQGAWMQSGVCSIIIASHDPRNRPSLGLAFGCRLSEGRDAVVVFLREAQSHDLLVDLRAGRQVSALFTQSLTTRALQLKAPRAREVALQPGDLEMLERFASLLAKEWSIAQPEAFTLALMSRECDALAAFELSPTEAFDQTPGPRAGSPLGATS